MEEEGIDVGFEKKRRDCKIFGFVMGCWERVEVVIYRV